MTRTKSLFATWIVACLGLLALAGGAAAADYIPGSELEHRQSGTGQFETYHWDSNVDIFKRVGQPAGHGDAGITLALYEDDGASATTYGLYGQQPFQNLTQPTRTGTGSGATPYVLESQYYAGEYDTGGVCQGNPCIRVTELAEYTSSAPHSLFMTYRVTNDGTDPIRFRLSLAADIDTSGSSDGTAFVENGVPRAVGTVNPRYGASAAWQEVSGSPWTSYQEGLAFDVWRRIEGPVAGGAPSPGLNEGTTGGEGDKVLAVQWDDYVATGLAGGAFRNFETFLRFKAFSATTLTPPAWSMTGLNAPVTIPLDVRDQYGSPTALQATDVRYRVTYGPNAPIDQSWLTATPSGGTGEADITWNWNSTKVAADDGLQVWIDLDHDRIKDESEPDTSSYANWFDPFTLTRDYSQRLIGNPNEVTVTSYTSGHALTGRPYKWKVTGANPQTNPGDPVNGMFDCNPCASITAINLLDDNAGTDTVHVWQDLNADTDYDDFGEKRSVDVKWLSGLYLHAASGRNFQGNPNRVVEAELVDSFDDPIYGVPLYYRVSGANPQGDTCATGATAVDPTVEDPAENNACKTAPTADIDWWGGQADIQMPTTNVGEDTLTVWYELDGASGSGPTAGDKVVATGNYATVLSPDQRLTTNAGTSTVNKTVGSTYDLTTSLRLPSGAADGRPVKIRYSIYSGSVNYTGSDELEVANNGSGNATISLPGTRVGYDDIDLYADLDGDKVQDSNEPWTSVFIRWRERVTLEVWDTEEYIPSTGNVDVYLQRADGTPYSGAYRWRIDGGSYTNDTTFSGYDYLTIPSQAAGPHTIEVEFTDTDGTFSDTTTITWAPSQVLALTRAAAHASTGATGKVTATLTEGGAPDQGVLLHYEIYGANDDNGKRVVETDATGKAEITWKGVEAGTDWVDVWPDYDEDGVRDANEGALEQSISTVFHERIELTPTYASKYEGNQQTVTVKFHDDDYQPLASKPLTYEITGANPVAGAVVTTNGSGQASIVLTGNEAGEDILRVWQDSDGDGQRDADELASQPMEMDWSYRISATPSNYGSQATNTPFTITANLRTLTGANQSGATLRWEATGVSPASGSTAATNASGNATFQVNSQVGGRDDIVVWLDSNGDGDRDAGEPKDELSVTWTSQITITCTSCTNPKPQGNTQGFTAAKSGGGGNLKWRVDGANDVATTAYAGSITLTGTEHGSDRLLVWDDVNSNSQWDSGEVASSYYMTWSPRLAFSTTNGYRVAGGSVTVGVTLLSVTGTAVGAGQTVNYTVTGANPTTGSATTNSLGKVSVTWSGENTGTDTLTVTSGSFTNSTSVYWAPPPVSLSLSHNTAAEAYQTNTHTVTATVNNATIPPAGVPIHFSVSGANTASQTVQSNAAGVSQFTWTGTNDGTDTVVAYADLSGTTGNDGYDPASSTTMKWLPLVRLSSTTSDQAIGEPHTETVTFLTNTGAPLANARVIYQISGANPTGGLLEARPIGSASGTRVNARTDSNGNAAITWTGTNAGTDTLDAWGDANDNGIVDGAEPRATKTITWRTATASGGGSTPGTGSTPVATPSQVPPANDFDGLPTPPPPVVAKKVNVAPVSGKVLVKLPGSTRFLELLDAEQIPVGSIVDVKRGRVALTASQNLKDSAVATAEFYSGVFKIAQKRAAKPVTDLVLFGGSFRPCGKLARKSSDALAQASKAKPKKRIRQLWGNGKGLFRTKGKYAAAAIRGTIWNVTDYCNGTLVKVTQGSVTVTDIVKKRNVVVKAKKSYFAEAKPARAGRRRG